MKSVLRRSERLAVGLFEEHERDVKLRKLDASTIVLDWRSPAEPPPGFFLPALGQLLTPKLRPSFFGPSRPAFEEGAVLSLLTADGSADVLLACCYESSVRYNLGVLERASNGSSILDRPVLWTHEDMSARRALVTRWASLVRYWLDESVAGMPEAKGLEHVIDAMRLHQSASRSRRVEVCVDYAMEDQMMDFIRHHPDGLERLEQALASCDDDQIEYLSECGFWSFSRLASDVYPRSHWRA